jgi:hypothetical protein
MNAKALADTADIVPRWPYVWPAAPDSISTRRNETGTCAGKHAVLAEDLDTLGLVSTTMLLIGPLVPALWADLQQLGGHLLEVHECLTVETPWAGPLLVDVTWHPAAIRAGLAGTVDWDGESDMKSAIEPLRAYAVGRNNLRQQKLALRERLYSTSDHQLRDQVLTEIAARAGTL